MHYHDTVVPEPEPISQQNVAKNLRFLRIAHAMSQEEVCKEIGVSRSQYSSLENGTKEATFPQLYALSLLYHISFEYLLSFDLSLEATCLLQEKISTIDSRRFLESFLTLSSKNRFRIIRELYHATAAKDPANDPKGEPK